MAQSSPRCRCDRGTGGTPSERIPHVVDAHDRAVVVAPNQEHVEAVAPHAALQARIRGHPRHRSATDAMPLLRADALLDAESTRAGGLDLREDDRVVAPRDEVDLAH